MYNEELAKKEKNRLKYTWEQMLVVDQTKGNPKWLENSDRKCKTSRTQEEKAF